MCNGADEGGRDGLKNCTRKAVSRLGGEKQTNQSVKEGFKDDVGSKRGEVKECLKDIWILSDSREVAN